MSPARPSRHGISRLFDLSFTWDENSTIAGVNPPFSMFLNATHAGTRGSFGDGGQLSITSEIMQWSGQHGAPSLDALGHIGHNGLLFGGVDAAAATSDTRGIGRGPGGVGAHLDAAHYRTDKLVNRGVLLDVARFLRGDGNPLDAGFEITAKHLAQTAAAQRVKIERGDTVLIRTGWGRYFTENPTLYKGDASPGPSVDGVQYLVRQRVFAVGNDTLTFEKRPPIVSAPIFQVFPVHMLLIADKRDPHHRELQPGRSGGGGGLRVPAGGAAHQGPRRDRLGSAVVRAGAGRTGLIERRVRATRGRRGWRAQAAPLTPAAECAAVCARSTRYRWTGDAVRA